MKRIFILLLVSSVLVACGEDETSTNNVNNANNVNNVEDEDWFFQVDGGDRYAGTFASKQQRPLDLAIQMSNADGSVLLVIEAEVGDVGTYPATTVQFTFAGGLENCGWSDNGTNGPSPASVTLTGVEGSGITGTFTATDLECEKPVDLVFSAAGEFVTN